MIRYQRTPEPLLAYSFSFLWIKIITLGASYDSLNHVQRRAVLAHERYHVMRHHTEIRALTALLFFPFLGYICRQQEYAADRYSASLGYGSGLQSVLYRGNSKSWFYPSTKSRCDKIQAYIRRTHVKSQTARLGVTD